jgi:hypothetical protein
MKKLPLTQLDSSEFYTASTRILKILTDSLPNDNYVVAMILLLGQGILGMEKALGRALKSEFTSLILTKDETRDNCFLGLREYIKSKIHGKDKEKAAAASKLYSTITDLGVGLYYLSLTDETAKLNTLRTQFKTDQYALLLTTIGGSELFKDLDDAQEDFEATYKNKVDTESEINLPLLKDSKQLVAKTLQPLLSYVESNVLINADAFKPIEAKIDEIIADIVTIARARITRDANDKKQEGDKK